MDVLLYEPGQEPRLVSIISGEGDVSDLKAMQTLVGGYIEVLALEPGYLVVVNEDGISMDLPPNFRVKGGIAFGDVIRGNAFVAKRGTGDDSGEMLGLTHEDITTVKTLMGEWTVKV